MTIKRIYVVRDKSKTGLSLARLVEATHPANALRHVAADSFSVTVATQGDLVALLPNVKVEKLTAEQQEIES